MLGSLTFGIIEGPAYGWGSARIMAFFAVTVIAVIAFLRYEPRRADPLIDVRFFRSLPFSGATLTAVSAMSALGGFLFLITLYLQDVRGYRPLVAGLFLLPMAAAIIHQPGRVADANPAAIEPCRFAASTEPITATPTDEPTWRLVEAMPDATPACDRGIPDTAEFVIGAFTKPMPMPNTRKAMTR